MRYCYSSLGSESHEGRVRRYYPIKSSTKFYGIIDDCTKKRGAILTSAGERDSANKSARGKAESPIIYAQAH